MFQRLEFKFSVISAPLKATFYPTRVGMRMMSFCSDNLKCLP